MTTPEPVIRHITVDGREALDEFVANGVDVHFEALSDNTWWIGITDPRTGRIWHINCGTANARAKGYAHCRQVTGPEIARGTA